MIASTNWEPGETAEDISVSQQEIRLFPFGESSLFYIQYAAITRRWNFEVESRFSESLFDSFAMAKVKFEFPEKADSYEIGFSTIVAPKEGFGMKNNWGISIGVVTSEESEMVSKAIINDHFSDYTTNDLDIKAEKLKQKIDDEFQTFYYLGFFTGYCF